MRLMIERAKWLGVVALACCSQQSTARVAAPAAADDTFTAGAGRATFRISGDQGLRPVYYPPKGEQPAGVLDLTAAQFTVANSKNPDPREGADCKHGALPINKQPLNIFNASGIVVRGGLIRGQVPQKSDWQATYCNSTALNLRHSPSVTIDGVRIASAWDGIRIGEGAANFVIKNAWLSSIRDDAVENDHLLGGRISDSLVDGALQGIALLPNKAIRLGKTEAMLTVSGTLIRLNATQFRGRKRFGSVTKSDDRAPVLRISNSVIAIDGEDGTTWPAYWANSWAKTEAASNNLLLWLADTAIPSDFPRPPAGFQFVSGNRARAMWDAARMNWINCHPKVARLNTDPRPRPDRCDRRTWGGFE
jgi:hypothetical protein